MKEITLKLGTDSLGRNFVAGKMGSGKSLMLMGISMRYNIPYITDESEPWGWLPMTCEEFRKNVDCSKGIVFDSTNIEEHLTDFYSYKWDVPVYYGLQLRKQGGISSMNLEKYKITDLATV